MQLCKGFQTIGVLYFIIQKMDPYVEVEVMVRHQDMFENKYH